MSRSPGIRVASLLERFPRRALGHLPTPLIELPRLAREIGAQTLWCKSDHETGLAFGGNKVRQLEFWVGEALEQQADTLLITGAVQSNYVRCAAAAAARVGLDCHVQLEARVPRADERYLRSGNVLLDQLLGAHISEFPEGEDEAGADARLEQIAHDLETHGKRPYIIRLAPGPPPLGALGYVEAARELHEQWQQDPASADLDEIAIGSGSGHTHAGLLVGLRLLGHDVTVVGICVRRDAKSQQDRILDRCREVEELLGCGEVVDASDVRVDDAVLAPGYGQLNDAVREAIQLSARREALLLDPVYTGRTMAGLIRRARLRSDSSRGAGRYLFVHTGGLPALFAYGEEVLTAG